MVEHRSPKPSVASSSLAGPVLRAKQRNLFQFFYRGFAAMGKIFGFFKECGAELKKVVWPTRDDVVSSVKVVIVSTIIIAAILGLLDILFSYGMSLAF